MPDDPIQPSAPAGVRLGPVTWVAGLRTTENDPWAHRKGEPRPLALLWSLYLMASALVTLLRVRSLTMPTTEQFGFGCRSMVLMVLVGVAVLWPMVRLSQQFPGRVGRSLVADLVVLLIPVQAVVWPMGLLTHWPVGVTAALVASIGAWGLLSSGLLACAFSRGSAASRGGWMGLVALIALAGPAVLVVWPGAISPMVSGMLMQGSPLTAAWAVTGAPSGLAPVMQGWEWCVALAPGAAGLALWGVAGRFAPKEEAGYSVAGPDQQD